MTTPEMSAHCLAVRQPIVDLVGFGLRAAMTPTGLPDLIKQIGVVRGVLIAGAQTVTDEAYQRWHTKIMASLDAMESAAKAGDGPGAWKFAENPETGLFPLSQFCAGEPGW